MRCLKLSETISTRLPPELIRLMEKEAEAKGISLSMLLREIVEEHYGVKLSRPTKKPFITELQEALSALGKAKMASCSSKESCPIKGLNLNPSPLICAICQVHSHAGNIFGISTYNPYVRG